MFALSLYSSTSRKSTKKRYLLKNTYTHKQKSRKRRQDELQMASNINRHRYELPIFSNQSTEIKKQGKQTAKKRRQKLKKKNSCIILVHMYISWNPISSGLVTYALYTLCNLRRPTRLPHSMMHQQRDWEAARRRMPGHMPTLTHRPPFHHPCPATTVPRVHLVTFEWPVQYVNDLHT